jgi:hypothetical protein
MRPLQNLKLATPCSMIWERMKGDDRVRRCERCRLDVHDLSAMTTAEAERLLAPDQGRVCVTFFRRADGRVLTKDCGGGFSEHFWKRVKAARHRRWAVRVLVAVTATMIAALVAGRAELERVLDTKRRVAPARMHEPKRLMGSVFIGY